MMAVLRNTVVLVLLLLPILSDAVPLFLRRRWNGKDAMLLSLGKNSSGGAPERWYDQTLDHFDSKNKNVWQQRYWVNDSNWDRNVGPVFLFIGGEGEENNKWLQFGEMMDLCVKFHGIAIILEHRYYGKSRPTKDASLDNLKYLSSRQALADMAQFHTFITREYKMTERNRWIAYGGSYSGALAAWMRIKYPHMFFAAVATSAPVLAEYDFKEYMEVVGDSLLTTKKGKECVSAIQSAMSKVDSLSNDSKTWKDLDKHFELKPTISSAEDCKLLAQNLAGIFMGVVQYNNDSRGNDSYDMSQLCDVMTNSTYGAEPFDRLALIAKFANASGADMDSNFTDYLDSLNETSWKEDGPEYGERQWFYQTCTEFGYFQTTDSKNQPFGTQISIDLYTIACQRVFGITNKQIQEYIQKTNDFYGGKNIPKNVTKIVFPNGSVDPWHALGITSDISPSLLSVYINGTAHCANMYPSNKYDRPELVEARAKIRTILEGWLIAG